MNRHGFHTLAGGLRGLLVLVLAFAALGLTAGRAAADECAGCPTPGLKDLQGVDGFSLGDRADAAGRVFRDKYYLDKGECVTSPEKAPEVKHVSSKIVLRGQGEVWYCPHSKSVDTITVQTQSEDSTAWSFSVTLGGEMKALGAKFKAEVEAGRTTGVTITEITSVSKTITPGWCHRVKWGAYFDVSTYQVTGTVATKQRWAWWTKNYTTGTTQVHAKGDIWMVCKSGAFEMTRKAPISGYFDLSSRGCAVPACSYVQIQKLGFFPPLPPHLKPPPDEPDEPDEPDAPDEPDEPDQPDEPDEPDEPDGPDEEGPGDEEPGGG